MERWVLAWNRDDSTAVAAEFADDVILHHNRPYRGLAAVRGWMREQMPIIDRLTFTPLRSGTSGDVAYHQGRWTLTLTAGGSTGGTHHFVWRRQASAWKLVAMTIANDLPEAASAVAAGPTAAGRSASACAVTPAEAEKQLLALEDEWNRAGTRGEVAFFERVLADEFVATGGRTVRTRADYIAGARDTTGGPRSLATLSELRVRTYGDAAVVSGLTTYPGDSPRRVRFTEVFACRDGRWQAVHGHYSELAAPAAGAPGVTR